MTTKTISKRKRDVKSNARSRLNKEKQSSTTVILDSLSREFDNATLPQWWDIHYQNMPHYLYHYTTGAGLIGIFESNKIWASNVLYMNDRSEILHGLQLASTIVGEKQQQASLPETRDFLNGVEAILDPAKWLFDFYVACFCAKDDVLSQWRGYAGMGNGYALAVFPEELEHGSGNGIAPNIGLRKVIYDEQEQIEIINVAVDKGCELLEKESTKARVEKLALAYRIQRKLFDRLLECVVCFKHKSFQEEEEWRMIHKLRSVNDEEWRNENKLTPTDQDITPLKFRDAGGRIVPYIALDFSSSNKPNIGRLPIEAVRHGPAVIPELAKKSLFLLSQKYGYKGLMVEGSDVPLRP